MAPHSKNTALQFASWFPAEWRPYFYLTWARLQDGHICVPKEELETAEIKRLFPEWKSPKSNGEFISDGTHVRPIIEWNDRYYLHRYFAYETTITEAIKSLIAQPQKSVQAGLKGKSRETETDWQQVAAAACLVNNFTIITGGPGTGKTTTVATILEGLFTQNPDLKVALAAPTGKAAARMAESLKEKAAHLPQALQTLFNQLEPATIHRLLGSKRNSVHFHHNRQNKLPYDIIIIDESSMIDVALFAKLLDAVNTNSKLILLGDKNQLASVEAGSLFGDLCKVPERTNVFSADFREILRPLVGDIPADQNVRVTPLSDHVVELQKSYRFSSTQGIGKLSDIVIHEDLPALEAFIAKGDEQVQIDFAYQEEMFDDFIVKFSSFIEEADIAQALKSLNECRVLCAVREGRQGLYETNRRIEATLERMKLIRRDKEFYENRPIIITKNNYQLGLYNGDTGIVRRDENGNIKVWFDINGQLTGFATSLISSEETAFAITIHKSQGSEFDEVLVLLPEHDVPVLTKELVYTAVTRARSRVFIQTDEVVLKQSIQRSVQRGSGLKERF